MATGDHHPYIPHKVAADFKEFAAKLGTPDYVAEGGDRKITPLERWVL